MNITDQQKLLVEEAKRRRQAAMADYERRNSDVERRHNALAADHARRQSQAPQSVDSQFTSVFPDTPTQAADTACSTSDSGSSCGGGE